MLKTIDVERDPKAFIVLRDAYDRARSGGAPSGTAVSFDLPGPAFEPAPADMPEPREPVGPSPIEAAFAEIEEEIFRREEPVDTARLAKAAAILLAPDRIAHLDVALYVEDRLLECIASGAPRSLALLPGAIRAFGWDERELPSLEVLDAIELRAQAMFNGDDALEAAYRILKPPFAAPEAREEQRQAVAVRKLRQRAASYPELFGDVDPAAWAWWNERLDRARLSGWDVFQSFSLGIFFMTCWALLDTRADIAQITLVAIFGIAGAIGLAAFSVRQRNRHGVNEPLKPLQIMALAGALVMPLVAVWLPETLPDMLATGCAAGCAALLVGARREGEYDIDGHKRHLGTSGLAILLWLLAVYIGSFRTGATAGVAMVGAVTAAQFAYWRANNWIGKEAARIRVAAVIVAGFAAAALALLLLPNADAVPLIMSLVPVVLLTGHVLIGERPVPMILQWHAWGTGIGSYFIAQAMIIGDSGAFTLVARLCFVIAAMTLYRAARLISFPAPVRGGGSLRR